MIMSGNVYQLAYAAGSTSLDPRGYRRIDMLMPRRFDRLLESFPEVRNYLNSESLIVSAYPAALGLAGIAPFVDTYLHPPTLFRSLRLAHIEKRPVLFASQPLAGADLLQRHCARNLELPSKILWANGGYVMPESLEDYVGRMLAQRGCKLQCLYSYGVAEIAHTCFAAMSRFDCGLPRFKEVATDVTATIDATTCELSLASIERTIATGDSATIVNGDWKIQSSAQRLAPTILAELESWTDKEWKRRTGYLEATPDRILFQLRADVRDVECEFELPFHEFWSRNDGSFACKPNWSVRFTNP